MSGKRGRPPKPEDERCTHFDYVRMTARQYAIVDRMCDKLGFPRNGGHSAAIRYAIDKMDKLFPEKK